MVILREGQHSIEFEIAGFKIFKIDEILLKVVDQVGEKIVIFVVTLGIVQNVALRRRATELLSHFTD